MKNPEGRELVLTKEDAEEAFRKMREASGGLTPKLLTTLTGIAAAVGAGLMKTHFTTEHLSDEELISALQEVSKCTTEEEICTLVGWIK